MSHSLQKPRKTYRVALLPSPAGTETKTCEYRPRPALEEQDREDHTERRAEGAADKEGAEAVVPLQDHLLAKFIRSRPYVFVAPIVLLLQVSMRDSYLLVQKSLAHGPVGADGGSGDGCVGVGVGHCEGKFGVCSVRQRVVNWQSDRCWELVVSNAGWLGAALGIKPIPSAKVHVPQYQKVEAASKDSGTIIMRPHSRFQATTPLKMGGKDLEMVDVDAQHATGPSLQRLKALDSLPDLKSQLKTANEYCNHGHRAEMIVKWLTTKMQSDAKAASNAEAWNLLEHCFRLVAPQKMGILLARFHLLDSARTSMQNLEGKKLAKLLDAITKAIETLEEISSGSDGAVVKQLLSTDGASAAALLGVWTNRVSTLISGADAPDNTSNDNIRLELPAVRLWAARKPSASDNDAFANNCLVPCSLLLQQLNGPTSSGSNKRRRGSRKGATTDADVAHDVEILIARHVFLPARSAFFQSVEKEVTEEVVSELAGKLSSVKSAIAAADGPREELCESLPKLLDVALRCVPMTTSRQRSKERPWVEHIFQELLACLEVDEKLVSQKALSGMLQIVGTRASLPGTTLKNLVQRYSGLAQPKKPSSIDFGMIAGVVALDATVFVDHAMADQLFPALTQISKKGSNSNSDEQVLLSESITKPVMRAFATSRKLENFVLRWQQQLLTIEDSNTWTVWTQLDELLTELLEVHLTTSTLR